MLYSYSAANFAGSSKRSIVNALLLVAFSVGNLAGTQVFQAKDKPQYLPGKISLLVLLLVLFPSSFVMHLYVRRQNKLKAEEVARLVAEHGWSDEELQREKDRHAFLDLVSLSIVLTLSVVAGERVQLTGFLANRPTSKIHFTFTLPEALPLGCSFVLETSLSCP